MANMMKQVDEKVCNQDQENTAVDVQYLNNGDPKEISWASIVNAGSEKGKSYSKKNGPVPALLAIDCENVSKAHLPLNTTKVGDDNMVLEMTVSSEFTLVGYTDEQDELIPDEETLCNYMDAFETGIDQEHGRGLLASIQNGHTKAKSAMPGVKQESKSLSGRPRGRPRRIQMDAVDEDENQSKSYSTVRKNRKITVKNESLFKCEECYRSFPTLTGLKMHMMMVHTDNGNMTCFVCGKGFESLKCLKAHVTTHTSDSQHFCDECGRWFKDRKVLQQHAARHDEKSSGGKIIDCSMCGQEYDTEADLAEHVLGYIPQMKVNACLVCGRHLAPMSSMEKHLRTHTGEKMASCPVCARKFTEAYNLKSHMRIHTGLCIQMLSDMPNFDLYFSFLCN